MDAAVSYPHIAQLGTILSVWAHPDDETWAAAGLMMAARANNQHVTCVTATRGERGVQDERRWPAAQLGAIRQKELEAALAIMDITDHYWLNYHDGQCHTAQKATAITRIVTIANEVKPDTIVTFGAEGMTGHEDHIAISEWVSAASSRLNHPHQVLYAATSKEWFERIGQKWHKKFNVFFNIDKPVLASSAAIDVHFTLPPSLLQRKMQALQAQESQTAHMFASMPLDELQEVARDEYFHRSRL